MGNHREIKSVFDSLTVSFDSRNNDCVGYWAIGYLCLVAEEIGTKIITLDLITKESFPSNRFSKLICENMSEQMYQQFELLHIPFEWLSEAKYTINFDPEYLKELHFWRSAWGNPYTSRLFFRTDLGKSYSSVRGGNCLPHNPERERRRNDYKSI
jgi:hypothetical protein